MVRRSAQRLSQALAIVAFGAVAVWPMTAWALPDRSIGVVSATMVRPSMGLTDVPMARMVGKEFVFLEKMACDQAIGYTAFRLMGSGDTPAGGTADPLADVPRYADFVGKTLRVTAVEPLTCPSGEYTVHVTVPESGVTLTARTFTQAIADVAPVDDLTAARQRWLGKFIYPRQRTVQTYDAATDRYGQFEVKLTEPLKVVDILWGLSAAKPLWIVVQRDNGERGFIATAFSWTNLYGDMWAVQRPWEDKIAESNLVHELRQFGLTGTTRRDRALSDGRPSRSF
ncbi:MAG: hypothetical protein H7338_17355 [Candidatus Sericytochromatia bacterium]|nr:hypothetical protein [Candidatus Sericytochromatia bacterium]